MSDPTEDKLTPEETFSGAALRRALEHAPDHAVAPDWRIRKAIQQKAREAVDMASSVEAELGVPWWKRLWTAMGSRDGGGMPWSAAFATVVVAVLVTVLWEREPMPGARLDSEVIPAAPEAPAAPADAPPPAAAQVTPAVPAPAAPPAEAEAAATPAAKSAEPPAPVAPSAESTVAQAEREKKLGAADEVPPSTPKAVAEAVAPSPPPPVAAPAPAPLAPPTAGAQGLLPDRAREQASVLPGALADNRAAPVPPAAARTPSASSERTDAMDPPTFAALSQWTRLTIAQSGGESRSVSRAEARELLPLLGSAAISAVEARRLSGRAEWRLTLERNGKVLAVFEIASDQVRWREGNTPSATGRPSAGALEALRHALEALMAPPPEVAPLPLPLTVPSPVPPATGLPSESAPPPETVPTPSPEPTTEPPR
ncbi:hypothetical protein [Variovorax sp. PAMC 28711]|uniref:hypothetical protein n=1 Tax=Variovorax sp. PAMC 28711 TaxID=1795631 RepID=UPI00078CDA09|nr:hypothetical protein [Variovorax sp. PAMC 28711]AMM25276.1 hypothetical protein AX767_13590 [Variovorax sp. PAMC 28711]